jgi:hypothetical protein
MAQSQNTVRDYIIANAVATETTLATFVTGASDGEVRALSADGTAVAAGKPFIIASKIDGKTRISDVIDPANVLRYVALPSRPAVMKQITVSAIEVPVVGETYIVDLEMRNVGSLSAVDKRTVHAEYVAQTGNTAQNVVDGLIAGLNASFRKFPGATATTNPFFTFVRGSSGATSTLVITEKEQDIELGKKEPRGQIFNVFFKRSQDAILGSFKSDIATIAQTAAPFPGVGTGKKVATAEYFYKGNFGDALRGVAYPFDWPTKTKTLADPDGIYHLIELNFKHVQDEVSAASNVSMPKELTIACLGAADDSTVIDALIGALNTATGKTVAILDLGA